MFFPCSDVNLGNNVDGWIFSSFQLFCLLQQGIYLAGTVGLYSYSHRVPATGVRPLRE